MSRGKKALSFLGAVIGICGFWLVMYSTTLVMITFGLGIMGAGIFLATAFLDEKKGL